MLEIFINNADCFYFFLNFLFSVNMQQIPLIISFSFTPARAASYSFKYKFFIAKGI